MGEVNRRWSLRGATALVTGGTKGIGHAVVEELAEFGASVYTCARNELELHERLKEWQDAGLKVTGSVCDLTSRPAREKLIQDVSKAFGGTLNVLVNNVGVGIQKSTEEHTAKDFSFLMCTNFESAYHMSQLAHPLLKASGNGSIVFMSSVGGLVSVSIGSSVYAAAKDNEHIVLRSYQSSDKEPGMRVGEGQHSDEQCCTMDNVDTISGTVLGKQGCGRCSYRTNSHEEVCRGEGGFICGDIPLPSSCFLHYRSSHHSGWRVHH